MGDSQKTKEIEQAEAIVLDTRKELEALRDEVLKYRKVFDSARLIVGHELNRPLTSISGYVELLEEKFDQLSGEKEHRYFGKIRESISELEGLVDSFLQMLRFDINVPRMDDYDQVSLYEMVEKLRRKYGEFSVGVENCVDPGMVPVMVRKNCLEIVLDNLVSNALKHSGTRKPVKVIGFEQKDRRSVVEKQLLMIKVEDHGAGIPGEEIEDVFDPFFKGNRRENISGLGLGLTLVKNVMNIMLGDIHIKSEPGEGTIVTLTIPLPGDSFDEGARIG